MPFQLNTSRKPQVSLISENDSTVGFPKDYTYNKQLQKGSEGHVEQWTHTATNIVIAVKVIRPSKSCPNEVQILRDLPPQSLSSAT
jgi:hypothetical protein